MHTSRPLPVSSVVVGAYFYSGEACEGVAYVDDVVVEPLALNPVERPTVSAYRAEAWAGGVSFMDWGCYRPNETNRVDVRLPTRAEMRSMTWQAIAVGANGLVYYSFFDLLQRDKWPRERWASGWADVCAVAREVKAFGSQGRRR